MKKLTKILSAVALCGVGAVTLAGCTDINLSQAQMDKIITVVDNSDKFMKDTMDLLNKQNKKLLINLSKELYSIKKVLSLVLACMKSVLPLIMTLIFYFKCGIPQVRKDII